MNHFNGKSLLSALGTVLIGAAAIATAADALAQRNHGGPPGLSEQCDRWLDGRPERNVPPHCRELAAQLNQVRKASSAFFSFDVAVASGWDTAISPCVESPMGGMGYHIANLDQLGNGSLSLLRPEVLLYAPTEDGSMEFLGLEYIVPDPEKQLEPPHILGQALHYNGQQGIWALHVWIGKDNPEGVFADWNPMVSCEFAPPPGD